MSVPWYLMAKGKGGGGYKTASGPIVSISDAVTAPLRSLLVNIDPVQDLHGYDAPWPAGGGKNKFGCADGTYAVGSTRTITVADSVWAYKVNSAAASSIFLPEETVTAMNIPVLKPGTYTFSLVSNAAVSSVIAAAVLNLSDGQAITNGNSFTISEDTSVVSITTPTSGQYAVGTYTCQIQIESGTSATAWTPYSNLCPISGWSAVNVWVKPTYDPTADPTATIQLGQTVYGGTLDVTNGVLTVTHGFQQYSGDSSESWYYLALANTFYVSNPSMGRVMDADGICNMFNRKTTWNNPGVRFGVDSPYVYFMGLASVVGSSEPSDLRAWLSAHPLQIAFALSTPITIPLTPQEISTLAGQNVMWADCGNVTVEYLASGGADPDLMKLAVAFMGRK